MRGRKTDAENLLETALLPPPGPRRPPSSALTCVRDPLGHSWSGAGQHGGSGASVTGSLRRGFRQGFPVDGAEGGTAAGGHGDARRETTSAKGKAQGPRRRRGRNHTEGTSRSYTWAVGPAGGMGGVGPSDATLNCPLWLQ